jgi:hypothetical protein
MRAAAARATAARPRLTAWPTSQPQVPRRPRPQRKRECGSRRRRGACDRTRRPRGRAGIFGSFRIDPHHGSRGVPGSSPDLAFTSPRGALADHRGPVRLPHRPQQASVFADVGRMPPRDEAQACGFADGQRPHREAEAGVTRLATRTPFSSLGGVYRATAETTAPGRNGGAGRQRAGHGVPRSPERSARWGWRGSGQAGLAYRVSNRGRREGCGDRAHDRERP